MNQYLCPLNKQLIVSALSPNRTDITVTKVHSYGNGIDVFKIVKWVVKNQHNQTVFLFQRENLKKSSRLTLKINEIDVATEVSKGYNGSFLCKIEQLLQNKERQQKFLPICALARKIMSVHNGMVYDHLSTVLQR